MSSKPLEDGQIRVMQPGSYLNAERNKVKVMALREDEDTPYVILEFNGTQVWMSDALAKDVSKRIERALSQLPTSK
jgi:hypothetical protein